MDTILLILTGTALAFTAVWLRQKHMTFMAQSPADFRGKGPELDLREHLRGPILCEGVIYGPTGRVSSRFVADFDAKWDGNVGVMKEHFKYDTGSSQDREWHLTLGNDGSI